MDNYIYILRCADGTLYTGWTNDPARRLAAHQAGRGGKYTRARLPVEMVYTERFDTKQEAMRREWEIKQLPREEKLKLIGDDKTGDDRSDRGRFSVCLDGPLAPSGTPEGRAKRELSAEPTEGECRTDFLYAR